LLKTFLGVDRSIKKREKEGLSRPSFSSAPTFAPTFFLAMAMVGLETNEPEKNPLF